MIIWDGSFLSRWVLPIILCYDYIINPCEGDIQAIKQAVKDFFQGQELIRAIYLFGSIMGKNFTPASDVDVGILYKYIGIPSFDQRLKNQMDLSSRIGRDVDLVVLNQASPILCYQVLKYGECMDARDPHAPNEFFVRTLNEYFDLKMNRRIIEKSLKIARIS